MTICGAIHRKSDHRVCGIHVGCVPEFDRNATADGTLHAPAGEDAHGARAAKAVSARMQLRSTKWGLKADGTLLGVHFFLAGGRG
jgi:hypothetical protein